MVAIPAYNIIIMGNDIGVYVCHCGTNIAGSVDCEELAGFAAGLPGVSVARSFDYMCSDPGQGMIASDIHLLGLRRVVVAACSPRLHEPTFRATLMEAGINPYCLEMANIREHCSWVHDDREEATRKAERLVRSAVARAARLEPLPEKRVPVTPAALVVGGGIAGIQASLNLARAGYQVWLVEREPSIGGHMAQLDKTFPTLDCSACILAPKMVEAARHPRIELLTSSEVVEVEGYVGNFRVKVSKKPRYVDIDACTGCGECAEACGMRKVPSEFEAGLANRSAIHIPFPQAVPLAAVVDPESCLLFTHGKCNRKCLEACSPGAIDLDQKEEMVELEVGAVVLATGFDLFDAAAMPQYGYGRYPDVISGLEFERLSSPNGPTGGRILTKDGSEPQAIAFLHCIGSRDENHHPYCSRICCMYNLKQAHLAREKTAARVYQFYIDLMAFGQGYQEFYQRVREEGVVFTRGKCSEVVQSGGRLRVMAEDTLLGRPLQVEVDMVVLGTAVEPRPGAEELARVFGVARDRDGFFSEAHPKLRPVETCVGGVFIAGCCQGPRDIPDTVAQASAAAAEALALLAAGEVEVEAAVAVAEEELCRGCGSCVEACPYGALALASGRVEVTEALCKGCGLCAAECLSGALQVLNLTDAILLAQIGALGRAGK